MTEQADMIVPPPQLDSEQPEISAQRYQVEPVNQPNELEELKARVKELEQWVRQLLSGSATKQQYLTWVFFDSESRELKPPTRMAPWRAWAIAHSLADMNGCRVKFGTGWPPDYLFSVEPADVVKPR